jgi:hypothetical protein
MTNVNALWVKAFHRIELVRFYLSLTQRCHAEIYHKMQQRRLAMAAFRPVVVDQSRVPSLLPVLCGSGSATSNIAVRLTGNS